MSILSPLNFLSPWYIPVLAAGLTLPPLVLLYFLKLKRREVPISSTLLWKRAVYDLQVNSPFQRLRNNLLLILQLLILLAAVLALGEPMWAGRRPVEKTLVLLVDHSASMGAMESDGRTRLAIAKEQAKRMIEEMGADQRAMLVAFADRAQVLSPFTNDVETLRRQIDAIEQTDAPSRLAEAMKLAEAHSTPTGQEVGAETTPSASHYVVFTDGRLPDAREIVVQRGTMEIVRVGKASTNLGIVDLDLRRNYERPEELSVLARVRNFGGEPAKTDVSLLVDGELKDVRAIPTLAPLGKPEELGRLDLAAVPPEGNEAMVTFDLVIPGAAELEVRLSASDALKADNAAWAVAVPPSQVSVLLVTPGNRYLRELVDAFNGSLLHRYEVWTPTEYEDAPADKLIAEGRCRFDVVILDGHSTDRLPAGNYLFFGAVPLIDGVKAAQPATRAVFLDWDDTHPLLRHVSVDAMRVFSWLDLELPAESRTLIEATNGPVLSLLTRGRNQYLICAFGFFDTERTHLNTTWVFEEGVVVFMANALRHLAGRTASGQQPPIRPGESFTVAAKPGASTLKVRRPDGSDEAVAVGTSGLATYVRTDRAGIYRVSAGAASQETRAVSLLDEQESFIAPNEDFRIAAGDLLAAEGSERLNQPLWPWLLIALGVILLVEWFIYNKRVFV